jgi:thioredoxin 2
VDSNPAIAAQYGIQGLPTLVAIKNGEVVGRSQGFTNRGGVTSFFRQISE